MKKATADVAHIRQTTQYSCCAASIASALHALGKKVSEDDVNRVLEASPMRGASWEGMLATVQYFGCRGTLVVPATPRMLKNWTDRGLPVVIAWNPENRPWSHASTVFDVEEDEAGDLWISVMDPNIPNPSKTVRRLGEDDFCGRWSEKVSEFLMMRRPAMVISREVDTAGRQIIASEIPVPKPDDKPRFGKKGGKLSEGWKYTIDLAILENTDIDASSDEDKIRMAPWDAGYNAGRSMHKDDMDHGSVVLGIMKWLGRLPEGIAAWKAGYEEGMKDR